MSKIHVKKDDNVYVTTGKFAGKTGKILKVFSEDQRVIVEGINMAVKHKKPRGRSQQGGIINQEAPIASSNVMLICSKCKHPSKTGRKILENGEKVRYCKSCGEALDTVSAGKKPERAGR
jgi:large subunit ribosomal protein L24